MENHDSIFEFSDLLYFSDSDVITVLKEIDNVTLLTACQGSDVALIWRIASVLSETAREYFFEDLNQFAFCSMESVEFNRTTIQSIMDSLYYSGKLEFYALKIGA